MVYDADESYGFAMTSKGEHATANAGFAVVLDGKAPTEYSYTVTVDGGPAILSLDETGRVTVKNADGSVANVIGAAWAVDDAGNQVPTRYEVDGSTLTQHVNHAGAQYPVVADPALECDGVFCTIMYTRSETKTIASSLTTAATLLAAGCTALGGAIAGVVCGVGASYAVDQANAALNAGKCVGLRALIYVPISTTHIVHEPCRS
ncbi:hypothetical protein [Agromyces larvae]|uniref:Uncharacterized protein n=1 Tax=Agromyces larvae TaxID=2929802 RepID=A0ABY4BUZ0_9MICO|nr:hypothetical protein [Agromyces larvae]UOE43008.1 hypothetical protein MTO99_12505 [Agromyces larvae]